MKILAYARHAEYASDGTLNEEGIRNAEKLAIELQKIAKKKSCIILYSNTARTRQTAEYISQRIACKMLQLGTDIMGPSITGAAFGQLGKLIEEHAKAYDVAICVGHENAPMHVLNEFTKKHRLQNFTKYTQKAKANVINFETKEVFEQIP